MPATLRFGSKGPDVAKLIKTLTEHGCAPQGNPIDEFDRNVENMVLYFQMTHQGKDGNWLGVDGVVGDGTWWALENATGDAQRSFLEVGIPKDITGLRRQILETAVKQHGVREEGSLKNRGKEVDKFIPEDKRQAGKDGPAWCCYFASWILREVMGKHPIGQPVPSVHMAWANAKKLSRWEPKVPGHVPIPGDAFVILHEDPEKGWCTGHIGFVLQVAEDGQSFNTVEGNCGNRVKIGRRVMSDPQLRGFINVSGDRPKFTRGELRGAKNVGAAATR